MAVDLIDPIEAIKKYSFANGVPEYEDMFIFAELTAQRRGRTIIMSRGNGVYNVKKTIDSDLVVNMLGPDKDTNSFTTDWSKSTSATNNVYEGFGITKVSIKTNASFVPLVTIDFVDIRGLAFFNSGKNSPYAVLHDFPPPMFDLTLKGYYGKSLTYQLHLVRQNTSFEGESGNYKTTAEFIARTFAPLTDVLFKYAELFPLIKKDSAFRPAAQANSDPVGLSQPLNRNIKPKGIYNLLSNIKTLYQKIDKVSNNSPEKKALEKREKEYKSLKLSLNEIGSFANALDEEYTFSNTSLLTKYDSTDGILDGVDKFNYGLKEIDNILLYKQSLSQDKTVSLNLNNKLYLGIKLNPEDVEANNVGSSSKYDKTKFDNAQKALLKYRIELIESYPKEIVKYVLKIDSKNKSDVANAIYTFNAPKYILEPYNQGDNQGKYKKIYYAVLEITPFYQKMYRYYINELIVQIKDLQNKFNTLVNNLATDQLGMKPTIRNIFGVICSDVDIFFNELRSTGVKGQEHHNQPSNYNVILGGKGSNGMLPEQTNINKKTIDAFPLYIETTIVGNDKRDNSNLKFDDCNKLLRKQKEYPGKFGGVGIATPEPFPEVTLVENFIQVFIEMRNKDSIKQIRQEQDGDGNLIFIPSSPYDSKLGNDKAYRSPYLPSSHGGVGEELRFDEILAVLLSRFYVFSQYTYAETFYNKSANGGDVDYKIAIAKYGGRSEASNISISLINNDNLDNMIELLSKFKTGENYADNIYQYMLNKNISNYNKNTSSILLGSAETLFEPIYKNKDSENYFGIKIMDNDETLLEKVTVGDNAVDDLIKEVNDTGDFLEEFINFLFETDDTVVGFSEENVQFINDVGDGTSLGNTRYIFKTKGDKDIQDTNIVKKLADIFAFDNGNFKNGEVLLNFLTGDTTSPEINFFLITSIFTFSKTLFTQTKRNKMLDIPAAINVPTAFLLYSAGLFKYEAEYKNILEPLFTTFKNEYLIGNTDQYKSQAHAMISVDDIKLEKDLLNIQYFSEKDKNELLNYYNKYFIDNQKILIGEFTSILKEGVANNFDSDEYEEKLTNKLISDIYKTKTFINYSELTLTPNEITQENIGTDPTQFVSLANTNNDAELKDINDIYFKAFIDSAIIDFRKRKKQLTDLKTELLSSINDTDIKNQCYYSFKNVSDKWLSGFGNDNKGFPFNTTSYDESTNTGGLIEQFIFVDRAFNDIGDKVVLNLTPLLEYSNDYDSSVFSVFSRLLALNGFEFFPLQNFMSFKTQDWKDSFKIQPTLEQESAPAFVCMYIGGVSSKLNNIAGFESIFENDGVESLESKSDIPDFYAAENRKNCLDNTPSTDNNVENKQNRELNTNLNATDVEYNQVKAFRVRFGEQNQAVFKNIQLDTREFKDTNESLAILSKISQDKSYSTPIAKGQNLFNTFEQRSYTCTIDMLGDMMIQPTQYFQLENIPMFSGAYLVLNVEHEFTANHATTSFTGVRILKYPVPYVTDFSSTTGIKTNPIREDENNNNNNPNANKDIDGAVVAYVGMNELKINI